MYFYDPDKNIVEFIARKGLKVNGKLPFGPKEFVSISEIGLSLPDIKTGYNTLNQMKKLPVYDGDFDKFCAAGDEHGLFIIVNRNSKTWFPTEDKSETADFIMSGDYNIEFTAGVIKRKG
jgi:catechol-2,3-dioxygenase